MVRAWGWAALTCVSANLVATPATAQHKAQMREMQLVGYNDLQGRPAFHSTVIRQEGRWIAYVGEPGEVPARLNPLTGHLEPSGTAIVDVTDPKHPRYLVHIPGAPAEPAEGYRGMARPAGAMFVHVCAGSKLPHADKNKFYLLRAFGGAAWEIWDVTNPSKPGRLTVIVSGLQNTHNGEWECDSGIAYLPVRGDWLTSPLGYHHDRDSHAQIYDLSDPARPVFIRNFGLPGQQPGSASPDPVNGLHTVLSTGMSGNRVYFANGSAGDGILEIVDREKLLKGPREPTDENLRYPVIARVDFPRDIGAHTVIPLLRMPLPEFAKQKDGFVKDFLVVIGEGHGNFVECHDTRQMVRIFDITTESKPVGVSTWTVPEASGDFCSRGGYFGTHDANLNLTPIYYKRVLFVSHFNAGVRALDIRDPYHPKEIAYYIPATNHNTVPSCFEILSYYARVSPRRDCKKAIDTTNVEVDDRGYIYIVDRSNSGMHILRLTGSARRLADFSRVKASHSGL